MLCINFVVSKLKKLLLITPIFLLLITLLSLWLFPSATPALGAASLLSNLAISIHAIFEKHKGIENPRPKIAKDTLVLILTILLIAFLGGIAAMLANFYVSLSFGAVVGLVSAVAVSFAAGYFVKKGMGRFSG
jgi:hypothetical protein